MQQVRGSLSSSQRSVTFNENNNRDNPLAPENQCDIWTSGDRTSTNNLLPLSPSLSYREGLERFYWLSTQNTNLSDRLLPEILSPPFSAVP